MKWINNQSTLPQRWALKQDIPKPWHRWAVKVRFRWETVWIVRDESGRVYMPDGKWAQTFDFHLNTPGHVIGHRDLATADNYDWAQEWRAAMHDRIKERLALGV